jgi:hypothetical protein
VRIQEPKITDMTKGNDPAFSPQNPKKIGWIDASGVLNTEYRDVPGLTKREYFAALAMQGWLAMCGGGNNEELPSPQFVADRSVELADALIESLNKTQP